jgi:hypothetical protein
MRNIFRQLLAKRPPQSMFDLSHSIKASLKFGYMYPILVQEVLPHDVFKVKTEMLARLAPMLAPVMHRINMRINYFFVPNRLVWDEFEDFITGGEDGTAAPQHPNILFDSTSYTAQTMTKGSLYDFLGFPTPEAGVDNPVAVNALPFRAYQLIYNEYYRDQNVVNKIPIVKTSGQSDGIGDMVQLRKASYDKDYFTSCLPWAQRGDEVTIPFKPSYMDTSEVLQSSTGSPFATDSDLWQLGGTGELQNDVGQDARIQNLEEEQGATINDLRTANKLQMWLEKMARGGSRYAEVILEHFFIRSSDARLQRPEYLGGNTSPVVISEVLSTVGTTASGIEAPQGNMSGHGVAANSTRGFRRKFNEHGFVIGILHATPRNAYFQGMPRWATRSSKMDYAWPVFANLGEQEVLNRELYWPFTGSNVGNQTFGYQSRYAEYKYHTDQVHGEFRDTLKYWHLSRDFANQPALNQDFLEVDPEDLDRIFAVSDEDQFYMNIIHKIRAKRCLPYFGSPTL